MGFIQFRIEIYPTFTSVQSLRRSGLLFPCQGIEVNVLHSKIVVLKHFLLVMGKRFAIRPDDPLKNKSNNQPARYWP